MIKNVLNILFSFLVLLVLVFFILILSDYTLVFLKLYKPEPFGIYLTDRIENNLPYDKNKKSVITAGCSFTEGSGIEEDETVSYKLQKQTGRKVYNRGLPGQGPQSNLYDIQTSDFFNKDKITEPEYYIYTFISDHLRRIYIDYWSFASYSVYNPYKIRNNKLVPKKLKVSPADYVKTTLLFKRLNLLAFDFESDDKKFDRFKLYIYAIKNELIKRYPKIKVAILVYHPEPDTMVTHHIKPFRTERWKELEDDGFIVLRFDKPEFDYLKEKEYISEDEVHPSGKAWDKLVPIIIDKLGLNK